jgi:hypothetical protein
MQIDAENRKQPTATNKMNNEAFTASFSQGWNVPIPFRTYSWSPTNNPVLRGSKGLMIRINGIQLREGSHQHTNKELPAGTKKHAGVNLAEWKSDWIYPSSRVRIEIEIDSRACRHRGHCSHTRRSRHRSYSSGEVSWLHCYALSEPCLLIGSWNGHG